MSAAFIRELQENVAKYGKENHTTFLMVQAIKALQVADAERDRLKALNAELAEALELALAALEKNVGMQDTYIDFDQVRAAKDTGRAALANQRKQA